MISQFIKRIDFWLRYRNWFYTNLTSIGSGYDKFNDFSKSNFRAHIHFQF